MTNEKFEKGKSLTFAIKHLISIKQELENNAYIQVGTYRIGQRNIDYESKDFSKSMDSLHEMFKQVMIKRICYEISILQSKFKEL